MRPNRSLLLPLSTLALLLVLLFPAFAGEGGNAEEESPAAQAYRDAWWQETGARALDKALEGYARAVDLEGSDAVRALALYRRGVLLERTGRLDEAIRAFERLAKTFPKEKALLLKARELLEAWTAEDLETSFDDWYERYRFSPAFQAKVVDLLLRLGTKTYDAKKDPPAEEKELLTIGEAALPALRRHLDTENPTLRSWVVALLLQLGEVPPVDALLEGGVWVKRPRAWTTLLTLPEEAAGRLRKTLEGGGELAAIVAQASRGPDAALGVLLKDWRALPTGLWNGLWSAVGERPGGHPSIAALAAFVQDPGASIQARHSVLSGLLRSGEAPDALVLEVLRQGPAFVARVALSEIQYGRLHVLGVWRAIAEGVLDGNLLPSTTIPNSSVMAALCWAVGEAGSEADLAPAVAAARRLGKGGSGGLTWAPGGARAGFDRLVPRLVEGATEGAEARRWVGRWRGRVFADQGFDAGAWRLLLRWAGSADAAPVREQAAWAAAQTATDGVLDEALALLPELGAEEGTSFLRGLRYPSIRWTPARLRILLEETARLREQDQAPLTRYHMERVFASPAEVAAVADLVLETPTRIWEGVFSWGGPSWDRYQDPGLRAHVREGLEAAWDSWTAEERAAALRALWVLAGPREGEAADAFVAWIRQRLRAPLGAGGTSAREVKERLLGLLPAPTLDDVRAAYDLEDPEQAEAASRLSRLPRTMAVYGALAAARGLADGKVRDRFWARWLDPKKVEDAAVLRRAARDMLEDPQAHARARGIEFLRDEEELANLPWLLKGLGDEDAKVRRLAAEGLAKVYDREALVALAAALDDPVPAVREAVLATLEQIRKTEELKAYWRQYAADEK